MQTGVPPPNHVQFRDTCRGNDAPGTERAGGVWPSQPCRGPVRPAYACQRTPRGRERAAPCPLPGAPGRPHLPSDYAGGVSELWRANPVSEDCVPHIHTQELHRGVGRR